MSIISQQPGQQSGQQSLQSSSQLPGPPSGPPWAVHPGDVSDARQPLTGVARDYPTSHRFGAHRHLRAQLVHALHGVLTVTAQGRSWVVPPEQAVWVPAGLEHDVASRGAMTLRTLYVHPAHASALPARCEVLAMTALMRALVLRFVADARPPDAPERLRLAAVLLDEMALLEPSPLDLPLPADARLARVARALMADPGDRREAAALAAMAGASERTLGRLFLRETGMTLAAWRRRLKLQEAVSRLATGQSVSSIALDLGYESVSAFVAMFRRELGAPPARYARAAGRDSA